MIAEVLWWMRKPFGPESEGSTHYSIYGSLEVMKKCFGQRLPIPFHSTDTVRRCKSKRRY